MASQNRTLGNFDLVGIPSAPRGVPQIEVTFDIDANGIVHVSAKDLGTGKEQKIRIESSSGLSEAEIERMVKEAEMHAEEDKKERARIDARNEADSMVYSTEKSLAEHGDKIDAADRAKIQSALDDVKATLANENATADELKSRTEALQQASYKLAEEMYKQTQAEAGGPQAETESTAGSSSGTVKNAEDADFEVVD
jgi:molecular chaperone DnaK